MVKMVYFPVYFRLRSSGETRAQVVATAAVFVVTWATALLPVVLVARRHSCSRGPTRSSGPSSGALVIVNLLIEQAAPTASGAASAPGPVRRVRCRSPATFCLHRDAVVALEVAVGRRVAGRADVVAGGVADRIEPADWETGKRNEHRRVEREGNAAAVHRQDLPAGRVGREPPGRHAAADERRARFDGDARPGQLRGEGVRHRARGPRDRHRDLRHASAASPSWCVQKRGGR